MTQKIDSQEQQYAVSIDGDKLTAYSADARYEAVQSDNGTRTISGYAIVWGATTDKPIAGLKHRFSRGAVEFQNPTFALWHHDYSSPLADTTSGTLRMKEDIHGVRVEIDLPNTTAGNDTWELVRTGRVKGMSFAGSIKGTQIKDAGILDVTKFASHEVTVTAIPRFSATSIAPAQQVENADEKNGSDEKGEAAPTGNSNQEQLNRLAKLRLAAYRPA